MTGRERRRPGRRRALRVLARLLDWLAMLAVALALLLALLLFFELRDRSSVGARLSAMPAPPCVSVEYAYGLSELVWCQP